LSSLSPKPWQNGCSIGQMSNQKERLDVLLMQRGLTESRSRSQALVLAGEVLVDGQPAQKPGMKVPISAELELIAPLPYVSRGGYKLAAALDQFEIDVSNCICADVGACTGGFTDVLLKRNARRVYAIDVGYGQLDWNLRNNQQVVVMERTNARYLGTLPETIEFICVDVSFISLRLILPVANNWLASDGDIVSLIKPQFEAGPEKVGKGGVIRNPEIHRQVLEDFTRWSVENQLYPAGLIPSPIVGASGNREFLIWLKQDQGIPFDIDRAIDACFT
jgi:23S rRNA (cytidine1920-2'-O)/16S rRNA (cytidine1409-2'-O)-methyltransferase